MSELANHLKPRRLKSQVLQTVTKHGRNSRLYPRCFLQISVIYIYKATLYRQDTQRNYALDQIAVSDTNNEALFLDAPKAY